MLHWRGLRHGVVAGKYWDLGEDDREFKWNNYIGRYHLRHLDLMDLLAMYQPRANAPLDAMAKLCGFPGKLGMDGSQVYQAFLDGKLFEPDPAKPPTWNRGAYLVEGPAHCAECHSPRNAIGVIAAERRFSGGPNPEGKGFVPNITPDKTGLADWSKGDIAEVLSSGLTPSGDSVGSNMTEVVRNTSQLAEADRDAIAEYIKSLPPRVGRKGPQ